MSLLVWDIHIYKISPLIVEYHKEVKTEEVEPTKLPN